MNGLELNKVKEFIVELFKKDFKNNLFAIISVGSFTSENYKKSWSDIDLVIVFERLGLVDKERMAHTKERLERKFHCRFGINVITKREGYLPSIPEFTLDGKTLQGLLELNKYPERLLYCKAKKPSFLVPDRETVKSYSLSNIAMFLLRNRKSLTDKGSFQKDKLKMVVEKEVRAAFIMTKLGIQYRNGHIYDNHKDIVRNAKAIFPKFNFSILTQNEKVISRWEQIRSTRELRFILKRTDQYIEQFSSFIFQNP